MPHQIAERLRQLAMKCAHLAKKSADKYTADELEGISTELAQKAQKLDAFFK